MTEDSVPASGRAPGRAPARGSGAQASGAGSSGGEAFFRGNGLLDPLVRDAPDVIHVMDEWGRIRWVNEAAAEVLGRAPDELVGRRAATFVHPEDRRRALEGASHVLSEPGARALLELRLSGEAGEWHHFEVWTHSLVDGDGESLLVGQARPVGVGWEGERALRATEARYRLMVEGSEAVFFYEHDRHHCFTYLSPSIETVLGYRPEELVGEPYDVLLAPHPTNEAVASRTDRALTSGRPGGSYEAWVVDRAGNPVVLELVERPLVEAGEVVGLQGFARDVTERRRSQEALRESQAQYRALVEQSPDAIAVHIKGRLVYANRAAAELAGVAEADALIGRSIFELLHPSMHDAVATRGRGMLERGETADRMDMPFVLADGKVRYGEVSATALSWEGEPAVQMVVRDMTDRRRSERALRQSEERFRSLIENSTDTVAVIDVDGVVRYHSPSSVAMLGYEPHELEGRDPLELVHPDDVDRARRGLEQLVVDPDRAKPIEVRFRHRDGDWRILEVRGTNRLDDPAVQGLVLNSRDVTEERALAQQLRQAQKLEAVGRLAGGMAHDFNNLLTAIRGHAELLRESVDESVQDDAREILNNATRAAGLIRQLLAFARQQVLHPRVVDLRQVLAGAETLLRRLIGEDIDLTVEGGDEVLPVHADLGQLEQVVMNLAVNARDAMPTGGALAIRLDATHLSDDEADDYPFRIPTGPYVRMTVADSGEGIEPGILDRVFEPFFTTKQPGRGTGLGLSTVYGIVKQTGGYVHVESQPGDGTTFHVLFPRAAQGPADRSTPDESGADASDAAGRGAGESGAGPRANDGRRAGTPEPAPTDDGVDLAGITVLLVEDEAAVRKVAQRVLERSGCRVLVAAGPLDALDRVLADETDDPDLLLTDVVMPDMGGQELAEHVARRCPGIRVVYMSGYTGSEMVQRGILADGAPFLEKPFSADDLVRTVSEALLDA